MSNQTIIDQVRQWQQQEEIVVLATGVFDLLHIEHIRFLEKAKAAGTRLIVGIESDVRVKQIKGLLRPINHQRIRLEQLLALKVVDQAFILPDQFSSQADWEQLMADIKPDIYAISSHTSYQENKQYICQKFGVDLQIVHEHNPEISTTEIINQAQGQS